MSQRPISKSLLATFVEYAARKVVTASEWQRFIVNHYQDSEMEHARVECARIFHECQSKESLPDEARTYLEGLARDLRQSQAS